MPGPVFHDEMDEYRERIEIQRGPDRRAPKLEVKPLVPNHAVRLFVAFALGELVGLLWAWGLHRG